MSLLRQVQDHIRYGAHMSNSVMAKIIHMQYTCAQQLLPHVTTDSAAVVAKQIQLLSINLSFVM
jgi:hypothetical protein